MMSTKVFTFRDITPIIAALIVSFFAVVYTVSATTISTNINTGGTLTVSGASTLTGAVSIAGSVNASSTLLVTGNVTTYGNSTFGDASTDVNLFTGTLQASTTALFTNGLTTYGNSTFGDAASDANLFTGMLNASSTLAVTGVSNFYNNVNVNGYATTTASNGNISTNGTLGVASSTPSTTLGVAGSAYIANGLGVGAVNTTSGTLGVGTSTPAQELSVVGDGMFYSTGTTTIVVGSSGSNKGGCFEMRQSDTGAVYRIFLKNGSVTAEAGTCQ